MDRGIEQMSPKSGPEGPFKLHTGCGYVSVVTLVAPMQRRLNICWYYIQAP